MRPLNQRQRKFVMYYLGESSGTAVDAARRAGYRVPHVAGCRLLQNPSIRAAIDARLEAAATSGGEVLARLVDIASSDILDFIDLDGNDCTVDLKRVKRLGLGHIIKRVRKGKDGTREVEFEPKLPALVKLGQYFKLWNPDAQPQITLADLAKGLREKHERLRESGQCDRPAGPVPGSSGSVQ